MCVLLHVVKSPRGIQLFTSLPMQGQLRYCSTPQPRAPSFLNLTTRPCHASRHTIVRFYYDFFNEFQVNNTILLIFCLFIFFRGTVNSITQKQVEIFRDIYLTAIKYIIEYFIIL